MGRSRSAHTTSVILYGGINAHAEAQMKYMACMEAKGYTFNWKRGPELSSTQPPTDSR
jgi:hypothetical protein